MPAVHFKVRLPDGTVAECYSPSSVVRRYFRQGESMPMGEFLARSRAALDQASERVRERFGFTCGAAHDQWLAISTWGESFRPGEVVEILEI